MTGFEHQTKITETTQHCMSQYGEVTCLALQRSNDYRNVQHPIASNVLNQIGTYQLYLCCGRPSALQTCTNQGRPTPCHCAAPERRIF